MRLACQLKNGLGILESGATIHSPSPRIAPCSSRKSSGKICRSHRGKTQPSGRRLQYLCSRHRVRTGPRQGDDEAAHEKRRYWETQVSCDPIQQGTIGDLTLLNQIKLDQLGKGLGTVDRFPAQSVSRSVAPHLDTDFWRASKFTPDQKTVVSLSRPRS